jgi:DNA-directed RNA polymerase subunit K/omega
MSGYDSELSNTDSDNDSDSETETLNKKQRPAFKIKISKDVKVNAEDVEEDIDDADVSDEDDEDEDVVEDDEYKKIGGENSEQEEDDDDDDEDDDEDDDDEDDEVDDETGELVKKVPLNKNQKPKKIPLANQVYYHNDDDDDDDDEYEENYLQKFDNEIIKNYVNDFHPECLNHNYQEIEKMSIVVRNSDGIIIDPLHKTIPYLTKYEKARILGQRSKQIETGAKPLVKVPENIVDGYIIAELELKEKKIPFIIRRPIPGGSCEYWHLRDLENIGF